MSSRVVVECTFSNYDKKKRKEKFKGDKKIARNYLENNEIEKDVKESAELMNEKNTHIINNECFNNNDCQKSSKKFQNNNEVVSDKSLSHKCEYEMKTIFSSSNTKHCEQFSETVEDVIDK